MSSHLSLTTPRESQFIQRVKITLSCFHITACQAEWGFEGKLLLQWNNYKQITMKKGTNVLQYYMFIKQLGSELCLNIIIEIYVICIISLNTVKMRWSSIQKWFMYKRPFWIWAPSAEMMGLAQTETCHSSYESQRGNFYHWKLKG